MGSKNALRNNTKRIFEFILVAIAIVSCLAGLSFLLRPVGIDNGIAAIEVFHELPEKSVDIMIFGSSHPWSAINARQLSEECNVDAYNYSCMWQSINTTDLFVNDAFLTQNPKLVIVDVGRVNYILDSDELNGELYYTRGLENTTAKKRYLKDCFGSNKESYFNYNFPIAQFHNNWSDISEQSFTAIDQRKEMIAENMGSLSIDTVVPVELLNEDDFWQEELSDEMRRYLDDIVAVCNEHGAQVLFVTIPFYSVEYFYGDAMKEYALENGCDLIDFYRLVDEMGIDGNTDFYDTEHLNSSGAKKLTGYLSEYISSNYEFL